MPGLIQHHLTLNNENGPALSGTENRFSPYCQLEGPHARLIVHARSDINFILTANWSNEPYSRTEGWMGDQAVRVFAGVPKLERIKVLAKYVSFECYGFALEPVSTEFSVLAFGVEID